MASKIRNNYLPELSALITGRNRPSMVSVNITSKCNQKCVYCEIGQSIPSATGGTLSINDLKWIIDEMHKSKILKISVNGGEPFLFDGIMEAVKYAGQRKVRCTITTNGMTVHKLSDSDLKILKNTGTQINVSVDSFRNEIESLTRGVDASLSNALRSIEKLLDNKIPVTILTAISKYNYLTLYESVVEAYNYGVREILFQPIIYYSNYPDRPAIANKANLNVSVENIHLLKDELKRILEFEKTHKINTNVYRILPWIEHYLKSVRDPGKEWFFHNILKKFYCREVDAIVEISYNGSILPCGLASPTVSILGTRKAGLTELWSEATKELRGDLNAGKYRSYCNACCHHFSRNMYASLMKYPFSNRRAVFLVLSLIFPRIWYKMRKKLYF